MYACRRNKIGSEAAYVVQCYSRWNRMMMVDQKWWKIIRRLVVPRISRWKLDEYVGSKQDGGKVRSLWMKKNRTNS